MGVKRFLLIFLVAVLGLAACAGQERAKVVEMTLEEKESGEAGDGLTVTGIYSYDYEIALNEVTEALIMSAEDCFYEVMDPFYESDVWDYSAVFARNGLAQAGFDGEDVWLMYREGEDTVVTRTLDMEYGFYDVLLTDQSMIQSGEKIWTSPDGSRRLVKLWDGDLGCWCLEWQEAGGETQRVMLDSDGWLNSNDYDLDCAWSGDGSRVFVRLCPGVFFPESFLDITEGYIQTETESGIGREGDVSALFELSPYEIWMLEEKDGGLTADWVSDCYWKDETVGEGRMIVSEDGARLCLAPSVADVRIGEYLGYAVGGHAADGAAAVSLEEKDGSWIVTSTGEYGDDLSEDAAVEVEQAGETRAEPAEVDAVYGEPEESKAIRNEEYDIMTEPAEEDSGDEVLDELGYWWGYRSCSLVGDLLHIYGWDSQYVIWDTAADAWQLCSYVTADGEALSRMISFHQTSLDQDLFYGVCGSDIYRLDYEEDGTWESTLIYKGPTGATVLDLTAREETGDLLVNYILRENTASGSLKMELVLLKF